MYPDLAADVARLLLALLDEKAWFRHGLNDARLAELTGMSPHQVAGARAEAEALGLVERQGAGTDRAVTMLTPRGVARAQALRPRAEGPGSEGGAGAEAGGEGAPD